MAANEGKIENVGKVGELIDWRLFLKLIIRVRLSEVVRKIGEIPRKQLLLYRTIPFASPRARASRPRFAFPICSSSECQPGFSAEIVND